MPDDKTAGNEPETFSDDAGFPAAALQAIADRLAIMDKQLIHIDGQVHEIGQFIAEHRPALARALSLMSGPGVRWMSGRKRAATTGNGLDHAVHQDG
jgi:hypothetical protein